MNSTTALLSSLLCLLLLGFGTFLTFRARAEQLAPDSIQHFPTSSLAPWGVAFDGANVWETSLYDGTVSKVRASDGALLGSFTVGRGYGAAFDGRNIWLTNYDTKSVT